MANASNHGTPEFLLSTPQKLPFCSDQTLLIEFVDLKNCIKLIQFKSENSFIIFDILRIYFGRPEPMSLPSFINMYGDNFFSNENFLADLNSTHLLAVKDVGGGSDKTVNINIRDELSSYDLKNLSKYVNFDEDTIGKVENQTTTTLTSKSANISKGIRNAPREFHIRNSTYYTYTTPDKLYSPIAMNSGSLSFIIILLITY